MRRRLLTATLAAALAGTAAARGTGTGASSATYGPSRGAGGTAEQAQLPLRDSEMVPRHGVLGAPGAAPDALGGSRLGRRDLDPLQNAGEGNATWTAGDRVRSVSSADVRAARVQQAPELEWAGTGGASARAAAPAQPGERGATPAEPPREAPKPKAKASAKKGK
ncbi:MAG TPA: hypothetical protein VFP65_23840 [Anaeromyxobacteraceae bacterium]|nr:hypothetical protein [Anaeromyxobacteraceae bacterium]